MNQVATIPAQITCLKNNLTSIHLPSSSSSSSPSSSNDNSTGTGDIRGDQRRATLCLIPELMYVVWNQCGFGVAGKRSAKTFSRNEQGLDSFTFYRRNIFWNQFVNIIRSGRSANESIDKMYQVHGH